MTWKQDEEIWSNIDDLILNAYPQIVELCNRFNERSDEIDLVGKGILFGGLGAFAVAYKGARGDDLSPHDAFGMGIQMVVSNPHFQNMMAVQVTDVIDNKIESSMPVSANGGGLPLGGDGGVT